MKILRLVLPLTMLFISALGARASHVLGGNISWQCLGGNSYEITFTIYKDCYGASAAPVSEPVFLYPVGACTSTPFSTFLTLTSTVEISELCASELTSSSCNGGLTPGTQQLTYTGIVTLDSTCNWQVIYNSGDWNYTNNIDASTLPDAYITSTINASLGCNESPTVSPSAVPYECRNQGNIVNPITLNLPAGVTASFALATPQTTGATINSSINVPGYSNALGATVAANGNVTINTNGVFAGNYLITVLITFTQGGQTIGTMTHSFVVVIRDCTSTPTTFDLPEIQSLDAPAILVNNTTIDVCAGDSVCFTVSASNPNLSRAIMLSATWDATLNAGNPVFTQVPNTLNPAIGEFCVVTSSATVGLNQHVDIHAVDNACVLPGMDDIQITINVYPSVTLSVTDTIVCLGQSVPVTASGGSVGATYTWTVLGGDTTPGLVGNSGTQNLNTLNSDAEIEVLLNGVSAQCNARDTLNVTVSLQNINLAVTHESCLQNDGDINLTVTGGTGNYTYVWNSGPITEDIASLPGGNYCVTVTDTGLANCSVNQCATVNSTLAPGGTIALQSGSATICAGQSATLVFNSTGELAENNVITVTGAGATVPATILNGGTFTVTPTVTTTYTLTNVSYATNPLCATVTNSQVTITVRPLLTGTLGANQTICANQNANLVFESSATGGSYNVTYTANPVDPAGAPNPPANPWLDGATISFNPAQTTTYTITDVQYTTAPACPNPQNNVTTVTVNPLPTAVLSNGGTICAGTCKDLVVTLTGTAPWTISYTVNGGAAQTLNINTSPFNWQQCPLVNSTYCITNVSDGNGCSQAVNSCQSITINSLPAVVFTGNATICAGSSTNLNVTPGNTYDLFFTVTDTDPLTGPTSQVLNFTGGNYSVTPTVTTTYTLDSLRFAGVIGCSVNVGTSVTVTVQNPPTYSALDTLCSNTSTTYQVSFTVSGAPGFNILPAGGTLTGNNYVSANIATGTSANFTIDDATVCPPVAVNVVNYSCPILTHPGTMSNTTITLCGNVAANGVWNNTQQFLDGNDQQMFILHTGSGTTLGTVLATDCNDSGFNDADTPLTFGTGPGQIAYGTTYYISSVAGNDSGNGDCVAYTPASNFVVVSQGQPVVWNEAPTSFISGTGAACSGSTVPVSVAFTGTGPWTFTYTINGATPTTINNTNTNPFVINASASGTYALTAVSNATCAGTVSGSAVVTINPNPTLTLSGSTSICADGCADLTVEMTNGTTYSFNYTAGVGPSQTISNINTNNYTWNLCPLATTQYCITSVTSDLGCTTAINDCEIITINPLPTAVFTDAANVAFCSNTTLDLHVSFTGNQDFDLTYSIDNANQPAINTINANTQTITINTPGVYCIEQVTDINGCNANNPTACVTVTSVTVPTANAGNDLITCSDAPIAIGTAAVGGVDYSWTGTGLDNTSIAQPTATITNAGAIALVNNYTVTASVTASGITCSATDNMQLTVHPLPQISIVASDQIICFGATADLTASGAGVGGTYSWTSDLATITTATNNPTVTVAPVGAIDYSVTGTDTNNCVSTQTITVTAGDAITVQEDFTANQCWGVCEGTINLTPNGGFAPYTIAWAVPVGDPASFSQTELCAGTYAYVVTDGENCSTLLDNLQIVINGLPQNFVDDVITTSPLCAYDNTATLQIIEPGALEYTIYSGPSLENIGPQATDTFTDLLPGFYEVYVSDAFGCPIDSIGITISSQSAPLTVDANEVPGIFCFNEVVPFTGTVLGGSGLLYINWYSCADTTGCFLGQGTPFDFTLTQDTMLYAVGTDVNGCRSDIDSVFADVSYPIQLLLQDGIDLIEICEGECIDLSAETSGGDDNLTVQWFELPAAITDPTIGPDGLSQTFCPPLSTGYYVYASDGCNEPAYDTLLVTVFDTPDIVFSVDTTEGCYPLQINFTNSTDSADLGLCEWDFGNGDILPICGDATYTYSELGEFFPSLTVTSADGCAFSDTLDAPIIVHGYPEIDFTWEPLNVNVLETEVDFINLTEGGVTYDWTFATFGESTEENPTYTFPDIDLAVYPVCLISSTEFGCTDTLCRDIVIESILQVWVPNAFTPDRDDVNEVFLPILKGINPDKYHLFIYNRWGILVFETTNPEQAWTGNVNDGEYYSQAESFVWRIELETLGEGKFEVFEGRVTLIR